MGARIIYAGSCRKKMVMCPGSEVDAEHQPTSKWMREAKVVVTHMPCGSELGLETGYFAAGKIARADQATQ